MRRSFPSMTLVAALAMLPGCSRPEPQSAALAAPKVRTYRPFEMAHDARDPSLAMILGTAADGSSTLLPIRTSGRIQLDVPSDTARGRARTVELVVAMVVPAMAGAAAPATTPAQPQGARWQLGLTLAAAAAARALGKDDAEYTWRALAISDEVGIAGEVTTVTTDDLDGVASSGALAAGFIASLTGATVDPLVAIVGVVLPDSTLGITPRWSEHVSTMIAAGKRRIGIPASATKNLEELRSLAQAHGAVLVPLADVGEAYRFLCGGAWPTTVPLRMIELELPETVRTAIASLYRDWQGRLASDWAPLLLLDNAARLPRALTQLASVTQKEATIAEQLRHAGSWRAAIDRVLEVRALADAALAARRIVDAVRSGHVDEAMDLVRDQGDVVVVALTAIAEVPGNSATSSAQLQQWVGYHSMLRALAEGLTLAPRTEEILVELAKLRGRELLELGGELVAQRVASTVVPMLVTAARIRFECQFALDLARMIARGGSPARSVDQLRRLPELSRAVLDLWAQNLQLLLAPVQKENDGGGRTAIDFAAIELARGWPSLSPAAGGNAGASVPNGPISAITDSLIRLRATWGATSTSWLLLSWAVRFAAQQETAQTVADLETSRSSPDQGVSMSVAVSEAEVAHLLRSADHHARQAARAALVATGEVPVPLRLAYQHGRELARRPELALQILGLRALWSATAMAEAAVQLARTAAPVLTSTAATP